MGRAAVVVGVAGVLAAVGARRPVIRRWPASILQAAPCFPASEAPGPLTALHAAVGGASLLRGGFVGAVANAAAVAALAGLRGDADRSADVLAAAVDLPAGPAADLRAGPAADLRAGWEVDLPAGSARRPRWVAAGRSGGTTVRAAQSWPLVVGRAARRRHLRAADLAYGPDPAQRLDIWGHDMWGGRSGPGAPVLVQVHGGGWTGGDKALSAWPLLAHLAERGWVCVTINYRLAPASRWPAQIVDVKRALAWVRGNIARFGGDPGSVAVSGGSAGGHLAALAALTPNDPDLQPGFADVDTSVAAAVPLYGVHDFTVDEHGLFDILENDLIGTTFAQDADTWRLASPVHRAGPQAPPFLVIHGSADTVAAVGQSRRFARRLRQVSEAPVGYAELPNAQHGFDMFPTARTRHTVAAIHRFLASAMP